MNWFRNLLLKIGIDITPRRELYAKIEDLQNQNKQYKDEINGLKSKLKKAIDDKNIRDQIIWDLEDEIRMLKGCCDNDEDCYSDC